MLTASNVSYTYPEESDTVLEGLSFSVPAGSRVLVIGENGAGKSTLLRMIGGAHKTATGSLRVFGEDPFEDSNRKCSVKLITSDLPGYLCYLKKNHTVRDIVPEARSTRGSLEALAQEFGIDLDARLDALSEGELRKLHMMLTLLRPVQLLLIDECTRDVDMLSRHAFIRYLRDMASESAAAALPPTVLYATHILDDVVEWSTHILHVKDKKATVTVANRINPRELFGLTDQLLSSTMGDFHAKLAEFSKAMYITQEDTSKCSDDFAVTIEGYDVKQLFANKAKQGDPVPSPSVCDVRIAMGERVVLLGENGAGKTHLLQLLAGEHFYPESSAGLRLRIGDRPCFHDTTLVCDVAYGGQWWCDTEPEWDLSVQEMLDCRYPLWETCAYAGFVLEMFSVRLDWRARRLSSGQRKRVQLLLRLVPLKRVIFLDEATSDLDMPQRLKFLLFLQHLSVARGVTIVYCSHIYDDLMWWGTHALFLRASPRYLDVFRAKYGEYVTLDNVSSGGVDRQSFLVAKKEKL